MGQTATHHVVRHQRVKTPNTEVIPTIERVGIFEDVVHRRGTRNKPRCPEVVKWGTRRGTQTSTRWTACPQTRRDCTPADRGVRLVPCRSQRPPRLRLPRVVCCHQKAKGKRRSVCRRVDDLPCGRRVDDLPCGRRVTKVAVAICSGELIWDDGIIRRLAQLELSSKSSMCCLATLHSSVEECAERVSG